jgi:hypothetical protein
MWCTSRYVSYLRTTAYCILMMGGTGSVSQTLTYPFDVLRRKMQVTGMTDGSMSKYNGALDAMRQILRTEGVSGMYRGLWPNLREYCLRLGGFYVFIARANVSCSEGCAEYRDVVLHV